jgi:hypothetical protein
MGMSILGLNLQELSSFEEAMGSRTAVRASNELHVEINALKLSWDTAFGVPYLWYRMLLTSEKPADADAAAASLTQSLST